MKIGAPTADPVAPDRFGIDRDRWLGGQSMPVLTGPKGTFENAERSEEPLTLPENCRRLPFLQPAERLNSPIRRSPPVHPL